MNLAFKVYHNPKYKEFIRFCIVGVICTIIDVGVFYVLHGWTGYRIAMIVGFGLSLSVNYIMNIYWSFNSKPSLKNAMGVIGAHCLNIFVVRMSLMWLFVDFMYMSDSYSYLPTLLISVITNFLIIRFVINRI